MATLDDLLNNFGLAEEADEAEMEHVASDQTVDDEEQALLSILQDDEGQEKLASEGGSEMSGSLADLYLQLAESDNFEEEEFEKEAAEVEYEEETEDVPIEKLAAEYDAAGRIMARGFYDEFQKLARELEDASQASTPALGERGVGYQMETNYEDKGPIHTVGSQSVNSGAIKGDKNVDLGAQSAMGSQFTTAKHLVTSRAKQTDAK